MKAAEAMALKNLLSNWRVEAKAIHDGHACVDNAPANVVESVLREQCATELELVLLQLTLEHLADQKAYERRL